MIDKLICTIYSGLISKSTRERECTVIAKLLIAN